MLKSIGYILNQVLNIFNCVISISIVWDIDLNNLIDFIAAFINKSLHTMIFTETDIPKITFYRVFMTFKIQNVMKFTYFSWNYEYIFKLFLCKSYF